MTRIAGGGCGTVVVVSAVVSAVVPAVTAAVASAALYRAYLVTLPAARPAISPGQLAAAASAGSLQPPGIARAAREAVAREPERSARWVTALRGRAVAGGGAAQVRLRHLASKRAGKRVGAAAVSAPIWQRAGSLPVYLAAAREGRAPAGVQVRLASPRRPCAAGVRGVVFTVATAPGSAGGQVRVSLAYSKFADLYGGGWASRLRLVQLPPCALTSPRAPGLPGAERTAQA